MKLLIAATLLVLEPSWGLDYYYNSVYDLAPGFPAPLPPPEWLLASRRGRQLSHKQCPLGHELLFDKKLRKYDCQCRKYHLYWPQDGLCYREYQQGPCPEGHRLVRDESTRQAKCTCPFFWAKYEPDGKCYQEFTRGPCPRGKLFVAERFGDDFGSCTCHPGMKMNYFAETDECFELYHRAGPCPSDGHHLVFDYASYKPKCKCKDGFHLNANGQCYELNTKGPCGSIECDDGTPCYMKSLESTGIGCTCLPKHSLTKENKCYQPFTKGNCQLGEWLIFNEDKTEMHCENKPRCRRFDNWHWWVPHSRCYRQFTVGPCEKGKLFYLDPETQSTGCHCRPEWKAHYWSQTGECFEQESVGPCPQGQYFGFNETTGLAQCSCFKNFVLDPVQGICEELYTRGSCPQGQVVTADPISGLHKCDCGPHIREHFWPGDGRCYPFYERGPCKENEQFRSHPKTKRPTCVVWGQTYYSSGY